MRSIDNGLPGLLGALGLAVLSATACATPNVTNRTPPTLTRNPMGSYEFTATIDPNDMRIEDVRAVAGGTRWPMTPVSGNLYEAVVFPDPCARTVTYRYEVEYRRRSLGGGPGYAPVTETLTSPSIGRHTLALQGEPPQGCPTTSARVFIVNTTADGIDDDPTDGVCATVAGACSLRAAVMQANANPGHDLIEVPPGTYMLTLTGSETVDVPDPAHGDLDITDTVSIRGRNESTVTIVGGSQRIFDVHVAVSRGIVQFSMLTLRDGAPASGPGGAIFNRGETLVQRVRFQDNHLSGAIDNTCGASVTTRICNRGGAIFNEGRMAVVQSTFTRNRTCDFSMCMGQSGHGGAISSFGDDAHLEIEASTFDGNSARFVGAVMNYGGFVNVINSTFHENRGGWASAIGTYAGSVHVFHGTFAATTGRPFFDAESGRFILANSIVHSRASIAGGAFCSGSFVSFGHNYIGGGGSIADLVGSCDLGSSDVTGFFVLGSLDDNGGPTPTIEISPYDPESLGLEVVDGAESSLYCPATDQRGQPRPRDGDGDGTAVCDPGAFEAP